MSNHRGELTGRIALITGAAGAIGKAIGEMFAFEGAHVVVTDLDSDRCDQIARALCHEYGDEIAIGRQQRNTQYVRLEWRR